MKRTFTLFACVAICCAMTVSCKNAKTTEPTTEEVQAQKVALADSVLAEIDALAERYYDTQSKSFSFRALELTDAEKMVKPDYLLNPSVASTLVTKSQKVNALAMYIVDKGVRMLFDMPLDETNDAIAKLVTEINHPIDLEFLTSDATVAEEIKREYDVCKERGDLAYFWQFHYAFMTEVSYIIAQDPNLFFSKITDEQSQVLHSRFSTLLIEVEELAKYDEEMSQLLEFRKKYKMFPSNEDGDSIMQNTETAKQYFIANKDKFIACRNALLQ